ncbi:MAG: class I tRNA ligase family protein [Acidimicrobiales bacterium]
MGRFYITTPIYYVNDAPHIGHAYTTVIADAIARWHRLLGDETFFLTGTDEHGLKVQRAAEENGLTPHAHADVTSQRFRDTWKSIDVAPDQFIRTTEERHHRATQELLTRVRDNGYIYESTYAGFYCVACEAYYNEDDLGPDNACPIHERPVEWLEEDNYFFKLSALENELTDWLTSGAVQPEGKRNEALGIVKQGLEDISITRTSISWGVQVPWDPDHVFYVWYDALINYATAVGFGTDDANFEAWWPTVHHVIGKDILRFHCVYWPAMLIAAGLEPPRQVNVHGFLLLGGKKLSKTGLTQIAPEELTADFGVDGFRYHLLRDVSFGPDSDFSYEGMVTRYNTDLANNLGNLLSRVVTVVGKKCDGIAPAPDPNSILAPTAAKSLADAMQGWENFQPSVALDATWRLVRETNGYLEDNEPWKLEAGSDEVKRVLGDALEVLRITAILASPALTRASRQLWQAIGLEGDPTDARVPDDVAWGGYPGGANLERGGPLFPRLDVG